MPNPSILDKPAADRPWYKRLTIISAAVFSGIQAAEVAGYVPPGTATATTAAAGKIVSAFTALIGLYRQVAN